jgi:hypothetical protein
MNEGKKINGKKISGMVLVLKFSHIFLALGRRDGKKEIEPSHINELHVVFGMFRDFLPSRLGIR